MLTPQEITREAEKLSTTMNKVRSVGLELSTLFSELDRSATQLKDAGIEMSIHFNDKPELQAAWTTYKTGNNLDQLPHILRVHSA